MSDFNQLQENSDSLIAQLNTTLAGFEGMSGPQKQAKANEANQLLNQLERILQDIVAQSTLWSIEERRESKDYITILKTQITNYQNLIALNTDQNQEIIDGQIVGESIDSPLIDKGNSGELEVEENNEVKLETNTPCLRIARIILTVILIVCIIYIVYELVN